MGTVEAASRQWWPDRATGNRNSLVGGRVKRERKTKCFNWSFPAWFSALPFVRLAANNILGTVMRRGGAIGCEVIVSGKVRGQRAKAQKYTQGYQVSTGQPKYDFIDSATRSVELRQGVIGLKVKIMQGTEIKT